MVKEFTFYGKSLEEVKKLSLKEFIQLAPARARRSLKRGFTAQQKILLEKVKKAKQGNYKKPIRTHVRDIIILPELLDLTIHVHNGKEFVPITIVPEMLGLYLGELTTNRKKVQHSAPGIGATKSSSAISVRG